MGQCEGFRMNFLRERAGHLRCRMAPGDGFINFRIGDRRFVDQEVGIFRKARQRGGRSGGIAEDSNLPRWRRRKDDIRSSYYGTVL